MKLLKQIFDSVASKTFSVRRCSFENIVGNVDTKLILNKAILSRKPVHVLLVGKPGCAKTMFLTEIMSSIKESYFIVGSNSTKAGVVNQLILKKPRYLLVDELDKMSKSDQNSLLHLMETGIISETKINKTRQMELTSWVFATANSCEKIIEALLSRFVVLEVPEYTFEQFREIAVARLKKEKVDKDMAEVIAEKVWNQLETSDIRDVIKVARLSGSSDEVHFVVKMLNNQERLRGMNKS